MKVRVGLALSTQGMRDQSQFPDLVDGLERLDFDSLWLSDRLTAPGPDPLVALAFVAGRTRRLKLGTSVLVVPGRNPVVLAKELASLDRMSGGRLLLAVGLGASDAREHEAFGIQSRDRAPWVEEVVPLMRRLWSDEHVDHDGPRFHLHDVTLAQRPVQQPIDVWLGGLAPAALRRIGRIGDGWLPSTCTVSDVIEGRRIIEESAAAAGRDIESEHFGAMIAYAREGVAEKALAAIAARRPGIDVAEVVPIGLAATRDLMARFVDAGTSKFVLRPLEEPRDWGAELFELSALVRDVQT